MLRTNHIHCMHALEGLKKLPDESIDMVITSPPYWNMRDYGPAAETIWDGEPACKHRFSSEIIKKHPGGGDKSRVAHHRKGITRYNTSSRFCVKCGAWKGQLGQEPDFHLYVKHLLDVFNEIKRVLKDKGTCWVNIADTYGTAAMQIHCEDHHPAAGLFKNHLRRQRVSLHKCLLGIPERFMLAMIGNGWTLRNKIIWHKSNHVPCPVKDRLANTWEYLLLFAKSPKYRFDLDVIRVPYRQDPALAERHYRRMMVTAQSGCRQGDDSAIRKSIAARYRQGRNPGDVIDAADFWSVASRPLRGVYFAVYPESLIEKPILAGCPGCPCDENSNKAAGCNGKCERGTVLDPFMGCGTTAVVAKRLGRDYIGFEPNPNCVKIARKRIRQAQQKTA